VWWEPPPTLLDPPLPDPTPTPRARRTDPETSHEAAASIAPPKQRATQAAVLDLFQRHGPMHDYRMIDAYSLERAGLGWPPQTRSGLQTRRHELVTAGLLEDSGERVRLETGRRAIVWRVPE
jgi:hypothetical protein